MICKLEQIKLAKKERETWIPRFLTNDNNPWFSIAKKNRGIIYIIL